VSFIRWCVLSFACSYASTIALDSIVGAKVIRAGRGFSFASAVDLTMRNTRAMGLHRAHGMVLVFIGWPEQRSIAIRRRRYNSAPRCKSGRTPGAAERRDSSRKDYTAQRMIIRSDAG